MKKYVMLMWLGIIPLLHGCDVKDPTNQPKTTTRSMIIGGVPVHDTDYKLAHTPILASNYPQSDASTLSR